MIWLPILIIALLAALFLVAPLVGTKTAPKSSRSITAFLFIGFITTSLLIYAAIGQPALTAPNALQAYQPPAAPQLSGPSQADVAAAQEMSAEDRELMILGMLDSLAAKLEDEPDNPEGWTRLIRSRRVMGQADLALKDIARVKEIYKTRPEIAAQILSAAEAN